MDCKHESAPANDTQYQIIVSGELDQSWSDWFGGMKILNGSNEAGDVITILSGSFYDQSELRGTLNKIMDLNLTLIAVNVQKPKTNGEHDE